MEEIKMKKLKICIMVDLNDQNDANMKSVEDFDAKTGDFYSKTKGYLSLLFGPVEQKSEWKQLGLLKHIVDSNHDYPVYDSRFGITGVHKDVQADE
jgi:hypothetical protein